MKALIYNKVNSEWDKTKGFELSDVPKPELGPSDDLSVIVKVEYAGVCGTDRGLWHRQAFRDQVLSSIDSEDKDYRIFGHELFGEVVEAGAGVEKEFGVKVGDKVSADSHVVCNECYQCKRGQKNVCTNEIILGVTTDGVFAEYIKLPAHNLWKNDASKIRPEIAAIQDPFGNAVHCASKADVEGKTTAIFGVGAIGQFLILILKAMGAAKVIAVDVSEEALKSARELGADEAVKLEPGDSGFEHDPAVAEQVFALTNGVGADVVFEMSGYNSSLNNCLFSARRGGDVVLFGIKNGNFVIEDYNNLIFKGLTMHSVIGRHIWHTWETTKNILEDKSNGVQDKIWEIILDRGEQTIIPLSEFDSDEFEHKMKQYAKLIIKP